MQTLMKFNPAFLEEDELVDSFVVRQAELELVLESIRENTGASNQHWLLIGPRGSGKTTLVLRVVAAVRRDAELEGRWFPVVFGEESYQVFSAGEFWLEALLHLADRTGDARWREAHQALISEHDERRLEDAALARLLEFADEQGRRLLLVVENLDMLLDQQLDRESAWHLRKTLQTEPRIMLLATATQRFAAIDNREEALFDLFRVHTIDPLDTEECRTVWTARTGRELAGDRIRPIQILTGGNPRLLAVVSAFAKDHSFRDLLLNLTQLVDDHTDYFKSNLDHLAAQERKVFVALADLWRPAEAREVARAARMQPSLASANLNRLVGRGAVEVVRQQGRRKHYQVAERMYNIYLLLRRRGGSHNLVRALVHFMLHFYQGDELAGVARGITVEACVLDPPARREHFLAFEALLAEADKDTRPMLIREADPRFADLEDLPETLRRLLRAEAAGAEVPGTAGAGDDLQVLWRAVEKAPADWKSLVHYFLCMVSAGTLTEREAEARLERYLHQTGRTCSSLHLAASAGLIFHDFGLPGLLPLAERWARELQCKDDRGAWSDLTTRLLWELASAQGRWAEALDLAMDQVPKEGASEDQVKAFLDFLIAAAAAGHAEGVYDLLEGAVRPPLFESIRVAMAMLLDRECDAPQEVVEVAKDVVARVRARRKVVASAEGGAGADAGTGAGAS